MRKKYSIKFLEKSLLRIAIDIPHIDKKYVAFERAEILTNVIREYGQYMPENEFEEYCKYYKRKLKSQMN